MSLTKVTYSMIADAAVNVMDFIPPSVVMGTDDVSSYIQAAIDKAALLNGDVFFPTNSYRVGTSLVMKNGVRLMGEGCATGLGAMAIWPIASKIADPTFAIFTNGGQSLDSVIVQNIRTWQGGYGFKFDVSSGVTVSKVFFYDCVFQGHLTACVAGTGTSITTGFLLATYRDCTFTSSSIGVLNEGPANITRIEDCSFEMMSNAYAYFYDPSPLPTASLFFLRNRCETVDNPAVATGIRIDGTAFNVVIDSNYFENIYNSVVTAENVTNLVFTNNFHTDSALVTGTLDITDSEFTISNNSSLSGMLVKYSGTTNRPQQVFGNRNFNYQTLRGKTASSQNPLLIGSQGISIESVPNIYKGILHQAKFVTLTDNTFADFLTVVSGTDAGLGVASRASVTIDVTILLSIVNTSGVNQTSSARYQVTVTGVGGATLTSKITQIANDSSGAFTLQQKATPSDTVLVLEGKFNGGTAFVSGSRANILYSYLADETASSGVVVS